MKRRRKVYSPQRTKVLIEHADLALLDAIAKDAQARMIDTAIEQFRECYFIFAAAEPSKRAYMMKTFIPNMRTVLERLSSAMYWHGMHVAQAAVDSGVAGTELMEVTDDGR